MALSAFKSTTRRRGLQGTQNDQDAAGPARTPPDHLIAHQHKLKYGHKRSSSFTDISPYARHAGDSSPRIRAARTPRFLDRQLSESDLAKGKPVADIDSTPSAPKRGDEGIHRLGSPQVVQADSAMRPKLQRSMSQHDKNLGDHPDGQVEEKIIRAVHAQNKPRPPPALSSSRHELYNMIKAEVFDVVADMKEAIEMTQEKALISESSSRESADISYVSLSEEIVKVFRYVCKGYATKIDKAEEEVTKLRTQLAEKERICLDLTNLINELIPESGGSRTNGAMSLKQMSKNITDGKGSVETSARSGSILDDEACMQRLSGQDILLELEKETQRLRLHCRQWPSSADCKDTAEENKDGLVLPWLTSEEANDTPCKENVGQKRQESSPHSLQEEDSIKHEILKPKIDDNKDSIKLEKSKVEEDSIKKDKIKTEERHLSQGSSVPPASEWRTYITDGSIKSTCIADSSLLYIQSTELISQRIQLRARVEAGELLLCIGTLHIY